MRPEWGLGARNSTWDGSTWDGSTLAIPRRWSRRSGVGPGERLFHHRAARRLQAHDHADRLQALRQQDVALQLLEVLERVVQPRGIGLLPQLPPVQALQLAV